MRFQPKNKKPEVEKKTSKCKFIRISLDSNSECVSKSFDLLVLFFLLLIKLKSQTKTCFKTIMKI